jgi:hypothetical protein
LRFGSYATSRQVERLATDEDLRTRACKTMQRMGITKVYLPVYRGGHVVSAGQLIVVRDWLPDKRIDVVGGIATVPGGDFGVRQKGAIEWFNWQNEKTQRHLQKSAFGKSWSQYDNPVRLRTSTVTLSVSEIALPFSLGDSARQYSLSTALDLSGKPFKLLKLTD